MWGRFENDGLWCWPTVGHPPQFERRGCQFESPCPHSVSESQMSPEHNFLLYFKEVSNQNLILFILIPWRISVLSCLRFYYNFFSIVFCLWPQFHPELKVLQYLQHIGVPNGKTSTHFEIQDYSWKSEKSKGNVWLIWERCFASALTI